MEVLRASYGGGSSDSDSEVDDSTTTRSSTSAMKSNLQPETIDLPLPPPPLSLLGPSNSVGTVDYLPTCQPQPSRVRSFPHVEGNYALHVFIPVVIPAAPKKELAQLLKKVSLIVPGLHVVDIDIPLSSLYNDDSEFEQVLGREFHISLGRTVPIRVHQIDSVVSMLRQKLQSQRRYWIDFNKWEVFVNDDCTRSFIALEVVTGGLIEITKQIQVVNEVYKLHNLPEFYENPRPHISLAWASGDISNSLKRVVEEETKRLSVGGSSKKHIFSSKFSGIECKIGKKLYKICKFSDD